MSYKIKKATFGKLHDHFDDRIPVGFKKEFLKMNILIGQLSKE
jgi:hypothetical protein